MLWNVSTKQGLTIKKINIKATLCFVQVPLCPNKMLLPSARANLLFVQHLLFGPDLIL